MSKLIAQERVGTVAELISVLQNLLPVGVDPFTVYVTTKDDDGLSLHLFEDKLSDGSIVYNLEVRP